MNSCRAVLWVWLLMMLGMPSHAATLPLEAYLDLHDLADAQVSPDGKQIVYARRFVDKLKDTREATLWVMNADGSEARPLGKGGFARWSPDGRHIAYVGLDASSQQQIFVTNPAKRDAPPLRVTQVPRAPANLAWSPDGHSIAFTMLVPRISREWDQALPGRPPGAQWASEPRVVEQLVFRRDGLGFLEDGVVHVFVVPAQGGPARQLTHGDQNYAAGPDFVGQLSWTPNSRELVFSSLDPQHWEYPWRESDVHALDVRSGAMRRLTSRIGPDYHPVVSPDGRWVAYGGYDWSYESYIETKLYIVPIEGGTPTCITCDMDRSLYPHPYGSLPRTYWWTGDSQGLHFNVSEHGATNLYYVSRAGAVRQITEGKQVLTTSDINSRGNAVGTLSTPHQPNELVTFSTRSPQPRSITQLNRKIVEGVQLGEVEELWYRGADGFDIQGWIVKPPEFDAKRKYPLILAIHGGPHAMYRVGFDFPFQEHAAQGYVVLYTNPRGSAGYGRAFGNSISNEPDDRVFGDLMQGVDEVVARGFVDERNLFVYGCSGGGQLTAWVVGHTTRFAAAAALCSVTNHLSFVGMTDGASFYWNYKKHFWEDPTEHLARSPIMYVKNVRTPTLFMTGELDLNAPISQAEDFYRALKINNVPTALVRFPDEYHGTYGVRPSNLLRTQLYLRHWFRKYSR